MPHHPTSFEQGPSQQSRSSSWPPPCNSSHGVNVQNLQVGSGLIKVKSVELLEVESYFDFHVPGYLNYWAGGVWHHNSGKSVALHSIICWLIGKTNPKDLGLVLLDPKGGEEFSPYEGLPHIVKLERDVSRATSLLHSLVGEMEARYGGRSRDRRLVVVIDEWAEVFDQAPSAAAPLKRLLQKARAARIHVVLATQRPSVKVISGDLKANLPTRLALRVATGTDSKVIIDQTGAERLLDKGDGLLLTPSGIRRVQVPWTDEGIVDELRRHYL